MKVPFESFDLGFMVPRLNTHANVMHKLVFPRL